MKNPIFKENYISPECEEFAIISEGTILTSSTPDMLGDLENNDVYTETF